MFQLWSLWCFVSVWKASIVCFYLCKSVFSAQSLTHSKPTEPSLISTVKLNTWREPSADEPPNSALLTDLSVKMSPYWMNQSSLCQSVSVNHSPTSVSFLFYHPTRLRHTSKPSSSTKAVCKVPLAKCLELKMVHYGHENESAIAQQQPSLWFPCCSFFTGCKQSISSFHRM